MRSKMHHNAAFLHLPIGLEKECKGILDLVEEKAMYFDGDYGEVVRLDEIPQDRQTEVKERRHELIEHLSNVDETLGKNLFILCVMFYCFFYLINKINQIRQHCPVFYNLFSQEELSMKNLIIVIYIYTDTFKVS